MGDGPLQNATPQESLEAVDLELSRAWMLLLKARSNSEIDKRMAYVDALLDKRLRLTATGSPGLS